MSAVARWWGRHVVLLMGLLVLAYMMVPVAVVVLMSFNEPASRNSYSFDGFTLANWTDMCGPFQLCDSLLTSIQIGLLATLVATLLGTLMAFAMVRHRFRGRRTANVLIFLPMAISLVGASIIWRFIYEYRADIGDNQQIGLANQVLVWLGFEPYQFLLNGPWNTFFLIVVFIWVQTGFAMTILSAAIKAIPDETVEAARSVGSNTWQVISKVQLPMAVRSLTLATNQGLIYVLSMVVVAGLVGGGALGYLVVAGFAQTSLFGKGLAAGLAIVLLGTILDRTTAAAAKRIGRTSE